MTKNVLGIVIKITMAGAIFTITSCNATADQDSIISRLKSTPSETLTPLRGVIGDKFSHACVMTPYQQEANYKLGFDRQINTHLKLSNYVADESHWNIAIVSQDGVNLAKFKRSADLDIMSSTEFLKAFPSGKSAFLASDCVESDGSFLKFTFKNRSYIVMGKQK